jgi:excisionase family DNA binding protein
VPAVIRVLNPEVKTQCTLHLGRFSPEGYFAMSAPTITSLSKRDVAAIFAVSLPTVDRLMASGELKYFKVGSKIVRFRPEDVLALMDPQRAEVSA